MINTGKALLKYHNATFVQEAEATMEEQFIECVMSTAGWTAAEVNLERGPVCRTQVLVSSS